MKYNALLLVDTGVAIQGDASKETEDGK